MTIGGVTLWFFDIAMENGPFIDDKHDDLPIKNGDCPVHNNHFPYGASIKCVINMMIFQFTYHKHDFQRGTPRTSQKFRAMALRLPFRAMPIFGGDRPMSVPTATEYTWWGWCIHRLIWEKNTRNYRDQRFQPQNIADSCNLILKPLGFYSRVGSTEFWLTLGGNFLHHRLALYYCIWVKAINPQMHGWIMHVVPQFCGSIDVHWTTSTSALTNPHPKCPWSSGPSISLSDHGNTQKFKSYISLNYMMHYN